MVAQNIRSALAEMERDGCLIRVGAPVDRDFEPAAVLWELSHGPAVVFENVTGFSVPLVGNVLNTRHKLAVSLGCSDEDLQDRLLRAVEGRLVPTVVEDAPCQQEVHKGDLDLFADLPIPWISEGDGGRYISAGILVCRDPDSGRQNMAICRLEVKEGNAFGCYMAPTHSFRALVGHGAVGAPMDVAVVVGCHPAILAASQFLVPFDEAEVAGGIFGDPLEVARCKTVDLTVPAGAEIVFEGTITPGDVEAEGPFGEFPGTYAPSRDNPVIRLTTRTNRRSPWLQMIVGGRHPEHLVTGAVAREATLLQSVRAVVPGVRRVVLTEGGNCRFHAVISMEPRVPGEAKLAIVAAFTSQDLIKHVVVVDEDIDPGDPGEVEWAMSTRMRAPEDLVMISGMKSNPVDPTSVGRTITKVGIDATLPVGDVRRSERRVGVPASVMASIRERWGDITNNQAVPAVPVRTVGHPNPVGTANVSDPQDPDSSGSFR